MKFLLILAALLVSTYAQTLNLGTDCGRGTSSVSKIVGGSIAAKGNWGWQIGLNMFDSLMCGGSLINNQWVVTAAHCIPYFSPSYYSVIIGYNDRSIADSWSITRKASKIIVHSSYSESSMKNDIALIKLSSPVTFDTVNYRITPACIPTGSEDYASRTGYVTGYGTLTSGGSVSRYLRQVDVPVMTTSYCENRFKVDSKTQVCAGYSKLGKDTCQGDSGGPLVVKSYDGRWHLVGLTSYGPNPCGEGGVYTRLSGFQNWILSNIQSN